MIVSLFFADLTIGGQKILPLFGAELPLEWTIMLLILCPAMATAFSERYAGTLMKRVDNILFEECEPKKFTEKYEKFIPKMVEALIPYMRLKLCNGYLAAGETAAAKKTVDMARWFPRNKTNNALFRLEYFGNLVEYNRLVEDWAAADERLGQMKEILADSTNGMKQKSRDDFRRIYDFQQYAANIARDKFDGAEEFFLTAFDTEKTKLSKVAAKCSLGKVYLHFNKTAEAKAALEYVIANGNTTRYVEEAKELLEHINE